MAKKLVEYYDYTFALKLSEKLKSADHLFRADLFLDYLKNNLAEESFLQRQDLYVNALEMSLSGNYLKHLETFKKIWGPELKKETGMFTEGWWLWPMGRFIEKHGLKDEIATYDFLYDFTKRQTGEYAIRYLLVKDPLKTMNVLLKWSKDVNVHVRRLASEAVRIALPWSFKTTVALNHFNIYEKILTNLKDDKSKFIQKSVGNNLNDLYKHDPNLAFKVIDEWQKEALTDATKWIINHGLRSRKIKE